MKLKLKPLILAVLATTTFLGAGCVSQPNVAQNNNSAINSAQPQTNSNINPVNEKTGGTEISTTTPCPTENTVRFWNVGASGNGFTVCYNSTFNNKPIVVKNFGQKLVFYVNGSPEWNHTVTLLNLKNQTSLKDEIKNRYMTEENKKYCDVISNKNNGGETLVVISNEGNPEAQEKCGEFRYGEFIYNQNSPENLFFVTLGQDTFMTSNWLSTLEAVYNSENKTPTVPVSNEYTNEISTFTDENLSFSYPSNWGPIITDIEMGYPNGNDTATVATCQHQQFYQLAGIGSGLFMAADNADNCGPAGRGGWFGDQAQNFSSWDNIVTWCGSGCEIFTNTNGLKIAHKYTAETEIWGDQIKDLDEYAFLNANGDLPGFIVSNERLIQSGLGRSEKELRDLINSMKFE